MDYVESISRYIREHFAGKKIRVESSNETMYLDLETGEMISDSLTNEVWNMEIPPRRDW